MTSDQIIAIAMIAAGLGDLAAIPFLRHRLPPPQARTISIVLVTFACAMIALGVAIWLRP